jgi:hypothetical protein
MADRLFTIHCPLRVQQNLLEEVQLFRDEALLAWGLATIGLAWLSGYSVGESLEKVCWNLPIS